MNVPTSSHPVVRRALVITGVVQAVGFRPFVYALAHRFAIVGWVANVAGRVEIDAEGPAPALEAFEAALRAEAPALSRIDTISSTPRPSAGAGHFEIRASASSTPAEFGASAIPADVATCSACLAELTDPDDRRFGYPFINCTACGPRYTIVQTLPYDRQRTTMCAFTMCAECEAEYRDPSNRRFHAEPIACANCGPHVWYEPGGPEPASPLAHRDTALAMTRRVLAAGSIVGIKGIGGFHLACDARSHEAVRTLRARKHRPTKPLAIMVASVADARRLAHVSDLEAAALADPARPIVLLRQRTNSSAISPLVCAGLAQIGIMLPYAPVHTLLAGAMPLVLTSGNISDEPIVIDNRAARVGLGAMVDGFLMHDRDIQCPCDDSVVQVIDEQVVHIRRSRGYAPLAIRLPDTGASVLAAGADLKAVVAVAVGDAVTMSQHIGDQGSPDTQTAFEQAAEQLLEATGAQPVAIAADAHPGYLSSAWARRVATQRGIPLLRVQHHHAHVASLLAEHGRPVDRACIGVAFDGTGYGPDGAIWGGEILVAQARTYARAAHLAYVPLPGGDGAVRYPRRMALAHLHAAGVEWTDALPCVAATPLMERRVLTRQFSSGVGCVPTSSVGRLLDATASLLGLVHEVTFEAEAAMRLESVATCYCDDPDALGEPATSLISWPEDSTLSAEHSLPSGSPTPLIVALAEAMHSGQDIACLAWRTHATLVQWVRLVCRTLRLRTGLEDVALSGGVMQNALLLGGLARGLRADGFVVLIPRAVPPNDGGIALGQAYITQASLRREPSPPLPGAFPLQYAAEWLS